MNLLERKELCINSKFYSRGYNFKNEYTLYENRYYISFEVDSEVIKNTQDIMNINANELNRYIKTPEKAINSIYELESLKMNRAKNQKGEYKMSAKLTYSILMESQKGFIYHAPDMLILDSIRGHMGERREDYSLFWNGVEDLTSRGLQITSRSSLNNFNNTIQNSTDGETTNE